LSINLALSFPPAGIKKKMEIQWITLLLSKMWVPNNFSRTENFSLVLSSKMNSSCELLAYETSCTVMDNTETILLFLIIILDQRKAVTRRL